MPIKSLRVAIYARVSTSDQNCSLQLSELRQYVLAREWEIAEEYVDTGWSGAKCSRPALDRLMKDAFARRIDAIVVYKMDRWGRSVQHMSDSIAKLKAAGIRFIATTQGIDTDGNNPAVELLMNILNSIAQFERELIRERVAAGMKNAKENGTRSGKTIGRPTRILDRQAIRDRRAAGASYSTLMNEFNIGRGHVQRILAVQPTDT